MNFLLIVILLITQQLFSQEKSDLEAISERGVLCVSFAKFNTGNGDDFSVELMKKFAQYLDIEYHYVNCNWANIIQMHHFIFVNFLNLKIRCFEKII